jgi:hypothetical protein
VSFWADRDAAKPAPVEHTLVVRLFIGRRDFVVRVAAPPRPGELIQTRDGTRGVIVKLKPPRRGDRTVAAYAYAKHVD